MESLTLYQELVHDLINLLHIKIDSKEEELLLIGSMSHSLPYSSSSSFLFQLSSLLSPTHSITIRSQRWRICWTQYYQSEIKSSLDSLRLYFQNRTTVVYLNKEGAQKYASYLYPRWMAIPNSDLGKSIDEELWMMNKLILKTSFIMIHNR